MIVKTMPVGEIGTNCYLLGDESAKVCAVVDPGGDAPAIRKMIEDSGLSLIHICVSSNSAVVSPGKPTMMSEVSTCLLYTS